MAFSAITVNDGAATPVATTFTPLMVDGNGVQWFEQTTPAPANKLVARRLSISLKRAAPNGQLTGRATAIVRLYQPTGETLSPNSSGITPPPTKAYEQVAAGEFLLPERGTTQERKDLRVLTQNLLGNAQVISVIDSLLNP